MKTYEFLRNIRGGNKYKFLHEKGMYCSHCGVKDKMYSDQLNDDYYQGEYFYCLSCNSRGQGSPAMSPVLENSEDMEIIEHLKGLI